MPAARRLTGGAATAADGRRNDSGRRAAWRQRLTDGSTTAAYERRNDSG